ncbi:MAG: FAD/NAD(P)-binding protein [Mixta sp.]
MSVSERQPDDFVKWLRSRGIAGKEGIPRKIYGDYLEEKLSSSIAALQRDGHRVTVYNASVEAVTIRSMELDLFLKSWRVTARLFLSTRFTISMQNLEI